MKKKYIIGGIIFNILETALIFMIGKILKIDVNIVILIMVAFFIIRMISGKPKHYNKWYRCCLWSSLVFTSLYTISNLDLFSILLLTGFTALLSSGKADLKDAYMWKKNNESKYSDVIEFLKYNSFSDELIEFENKLKERDNISYLIYKYKFKDNKTFAEISELLDIETNRITEYLDKIAFAMRMYCKF